MAGSRPAAVPDQVVVPTHVAESRAGSRRGRLVAAVVAVAVVVVGLIVFSGDDDPNRLEGSGDPEALVQTPLEQTCTREIARLTAAIDAWGGIDSWAFTRSGQPALDTLASDVLLALARVDGLQTDASAALGALDQAMAGASDFAEAPARAARTEAVTAAATSIIELVQGHPAGAGCDLGRLRAAIAG